MASPQKRARTSAPMPPLARALRMSRPPDMAPVQRYLLSRNSASDLFVIADPVAVAHGAVISGDSELAGGVGTGYTPETVMSSFLYLCLLIVGLLVHQVPSFNLLARSSLVNSVAQVVAAK
jgi:hypothetical protein